jgi:hypothetical protein
MKRRGCRKLRKATPKRETADNAALTHDGIDALVIANARALGLTLDPAWLDSVAFNLRLILRHAALVDEFPLADDTEPAPIFHA